MSRQIKFRCWNTNGQCMHDWKELVDKGEIHLLADQQYAYPIMQFTGLFDENGKEIYEGDIIEWYGMVLTIVWDSSDASFLAESGSIYESGQEWADDCKVVGNIYENPELLGE